MLHYQRNTYGYIWEIHFVSQPGKRGCQRQIITSQQLILLSPTYCSAFIIQKHPALSNLQKFWERKEISKVVIVVLMWGRCRSGQREEMGKLSFLIKLFLFGDLLNSLSSSLPPWSYNHSDNNLKVITRLLLVGTRSQFDQIRWTIQVSCFIFYKRYVAL